MANPWDNDPVVAPAQHVTPPAANAPASAQPWDTDPVVQKVVPAVPAAAPDKTTGYEVAKQDYLNNIARYGRPGPDAPVTDAGRRSAGAMINIENGSNFNTSDKVNGGLNAAQTYVKNLFESNPSYTASEAYDAARDATNELQTEYDQKNPNMSKALNVAGAVTGNGTGEVAASFLRGATSRMGMFARNGLVGAVEGAAYGAGADKEDPTAGAITGGGIGAIGGVALPAVFGAARYLGGKIVDKGRDTFFPEAAQRATAAAPARNFDADIVGRYLGGKSAEELTADPRVQRGVPITTAELFGRNAMGDTMTYAKMQGDAPDLVTNTLGERTYGDGSPIGGSNARMVDAFHEATGINPTTALDDHNSLLANSAEAVNPAYTAIRANNAPVMTPQLQELAAQDPHIKSAINFVRSNTRGAPEVPDANMWLQVRDVLNRRQNFDELTGRPPSDVVSRAISRASRDLKNELNAAIPGYEPAQAESAQYKAPEAAFKAAKGMLFNNGSGQDLASVKSLIGSLDTNDERIAVQRAFAHDLFNAINSGQRVTTKLISPGAKQKLSVVFGDDIADSIATTAADEKAMTDFAQRAPPGFNSTSAEALNRAADTHEPVNDIVGHVINGAMHGGPSGAATGLGMGLVKAAIKSGGRTIGQTQADRDYAAQQLMRPASDFLAGYKPSQATTKSISVVPGGAAAAAQQYLIQPPGQ